MEEQAQTLLQTLRRTATPIDQKLAQFNNLKSGIKHLRVPDAAQPAIFECIKLAIGSQTSSQLVSSGFSTLGHLIKRLSLQSQPNVIVAQAGKLFPVLLDRFGDARESHRNAAGQMLSELWTYCDKDVERLVRDTAITGTNARAKEMGMQWVARMSKTANLQFKGFVPSIVANLEDPDGVVRDVAKATVIDLFRDAPDHAKADLKKQLRKYEVRHSIATQILAQLGVAGPAPAPAPEADLGASTISIAVSTGESISSANPLTDSMASETPPAVETVPMDPLYVRTQRELDEIFREMAQHFEGKETEHNWIARDKSIIKLRRLLKGNAPTEFPLAFIGGCRALQDGILKVVNSLRTTMSTNGCQFVQELAKTLGPAMDPMVELLLQNAIKMSAATKNIAAQNGNMTADVLFQYAPYHKRLLEHVWFACQDKNVQPRIFASGWLKTLIKKHSPHKAHFESSGGLELAEKCLKKGMSDANPKVREGMRATYWVFASVWPDRGEAIMYSDDKIRKGLESDPRNPNASLSSSVSSGANPLSKSLGASKSRPSLRDAIAAQRKAAMASRQGPERPASAQSAFSPVKQSSTTNSQNRAPSSLGNSRAAAPRPAASRSQTVATAHTPSSSTGSISAAPMRRPRRPDMTRPATADPYARRPGANAAASTVTPQDSPTATPQRDTTKASVMTAKRTMPSTARPKTATSVNFSPTTSPSRVKAKVNTGLHRKTPSGETSRTLGSPTLSPSKMEDLTMIMPLGKPSHEEHSAALFKKRMEKTMSAASGVPPAGEDDEAFTMVIPDIKMPPPPNIERTPATRQTPGKASAGPATHLDFGSPGRVGRSPRAVVPERAAGDVPQPSEVKVYEDPFVGNDGASADPVKPVLGEVQLSEMDPNISLNLQKPAGNGVADGSEMTHDRAEILRNRRLLASGIERIRAKALDAHGFRRLQDLIKSGQDIWGEDFSKFRELLLVLLEYLEASNQSLNATPMKAQNLKTQVLATIRAMISLYRKESAQSAERALCSVLRARQWVDDSSHLAADLERAAEELCRTGRKEQMIDAILTLFDELDNTTPKSPSPSGATPAPSRTITTSLAALSQLLSPTTPAQRPASPVKSGSPVKSPAAGGGAPALTPSQVQRLGKVAAAFLSDAEPDVRKADLEFCVALHDCMVAREAEQGKEAFWTALREQGGVREQSLNLITYYVAKRGRA